MRAQVSAVLREETQSVEEEQTAEARPASNQFNPLGIGIPVFFMGGVMLVIFPPVGLLLLCAAALLVIWGLIATMLRR